MKLSDLIGKKEERGNKPPDPARLEEQLKKQHRARNQEELQWRINLAFYKDKHYDYINKTTGRIDRKPTEPGELPAHRARLTANQVQQTVRTMLAKMTKSDPMFQGIPSTTDGSDQQAAQLGQLLFEYLWTELNLKRKRNRAVLWSIICGQGYWEIYWDSKARKPIEFIIDPETGQPAVNPAREEAIKAEAAAMGQEVEKKIVYEGEIGVEVISPFELYLLGSNEPDEAWGAIKVRGYDKETVKRIWNYDVEADGVPDEYNVSKKSQDDNKDLVLVKVMYIKPSPDLPEGQMVTWANDKLLDNKPFPYKHGKLPFVKFPGIENPEGRYDLALVTGLVPLNRALNRLLSQVQEYNNHMINPQWWAPIGSIQGKVDNTPGAIKTYIPVMGLKPEPVEVKPLPNFVLQWVDVIQQQMNDVSGQHEVTQGKVPPNVEAGVAIGLLEGQDDDRIHPQVTGMEDAISKAGSQMLSLAKQFYQEKRLIEVIGAEGVAQSRQFSNSDLYGCKDIRVVPGSTIPSSQAAQNDWIWKGIEQKLIDPKDGYRAMKIGGGMNQILSEWEAHKRKQTREIEQILRGEQPMLIPEVDDHATHIQVLDLFIVSEEFEGHREEVRQAVLQHRAEHQQILDQQPKPLPENVKMNVQLKDELTPSATAGFMSQAGLSNAPDAQTIAAEGAQEKFEEGQAYVMRFQAQNQGKMDQQQADIENQAAQTAAQLEQQGAQFAQEQQQAQARHDMEMQRQQERHQMDLTAKQHQMALKREEMMMKARQMRQQRNNNGQ